MADAHFRLLRVRRQDVSQADRAGELQIVREEADGAPAGRLHRGDHPNGSGKSNISDAILFVLGPKSSRAIRAGKLSDLIFNGGKDRSPANYCKVSLVFDNRDRMMPIDEDLVRLTRLIKLSQDREGYTSTFYVNDKRSSLGEFDMLLSNARISADGYNFVQQGDITRITTMSNLERRRIFDDISDLQVRRGDRQGPRRA